MLRKNIVIFLSLALTHLNAQITTNGLVLNLDASDPSSYSGSGSTWNDTSGNNNHFNINTATYNNSGYFIFDGDDSMTGPPSNSFGLSQTNHTIEIVLTPNVAGGSPINFRGNNHAYGINAHIPWSSDVIYYDVGGCCGGEDRISVGSGNMVGQKTHIILRSRPNTNPKREVFKNGTSIVNSGGHGTSTNSFTNTPVTIGGYPYSGSTAHFIDAKIYSVRVYNRGLTDQEIANNYAYYQNPRNISISSNTVTENTSIGTTIGSFSSTGMNQNGTFTYTLASSGNASDDDNGGFTISGTTLLTSSTIDYETKTSYNIYVNVNDGTTDFAKAFTLSVNNVVELTDELILDLDANNSNSYSGSGSNWLDLSGSNNHATFHGNTSFSASDGGHIYFDGNGDRLNFASAINIPVVGWTMTMIVDIPTQNQSWWNYFPMQTGGGYKYEFGKYGTSGDSFEWKDNNRVAGTNLGVNLLDTGYSILSFGVTEDGKSFYSLNGGEKVLNTASNTDWSGRPNLNFNKLFGGFSNGTHDLAARVKKIMLHTRELSNAELLNNYVSIDNEPPYITATRMELDNSKVNVIFSDHMSSTLQTSHFNLSLSGGSATLDSQTPTSITVSGTKVSLGVNLSGTPNGSEIITVSIQPNSVYDLASNVASTTQSNNTANLVRGIVSDNVILYLDARNVASYPGSGTDWYDLSSNGNDFRIYGATYNNSGYFDFDGSNDWARTISSLDLSSFSNVTVQIYFKTENTNSTEATYEYSTNWNTQSGGFGLFAHSAGGPFVNNTHNTYQNGGFSGNSGRNYQFNINSNWHLHTNIHSMVNDATGRLSYVDHALIPFTSSPYPNSTATINGSFSNHHFYVGSRAGNNYYLNGQVQSVIIYGTKLSANQVSNNYYSLTGENRPPTDISLTSNTITETASIGSGVGNLSAVDSDTSISSLTFTLASGNGINDADNDSFTISGTSLLTSTTLDFETKNSYNIYINVNDGSSNYAKAFTVSVTNILEPITDLGFAHISKAYKFNGTNNYIEVPYAAENHPSNFTIELWARLDQDTGTWQSPLSSRYGARPWNNLSGYNFYAVNGLGSWSFSTGSGGAWEGVGTSTSTIGEIYNGTTLKFGIWTHLASTYDGTTIRFYVNGALVGTDSAGYSRVGFNSIPQRPLRIGAGRTESSAIYFFNGAVDEVRIWNYARTRNEINNKKNAILTGQETGLVSYYNFDNGNASNETGVSARDGTLYNSPSIITRTTPYEANVEEESALGTFVGNLTATDSDTTDFTFSLVTGNGTNDQHNSLFTVSGTQLLIAGNIDYETNSSLNIYVQASDGTNTLAKALTINVSDVNEIPVISGTTLSNDNSFINVTFSEAVYDTNGGSGALEAADFSLSINGGTATLSSATPSSISVNGNTYTLGLPVSGSISGSETVTVVPIQDAIYDVGAATASTTQSNNTVSLHGDSDSDGVNDALDQCSNTPNGESVDANGCTESQNDPDNDGILRTNDNCPNISNSDQTDTDEDGIGDACDPDIDNDGIANGSDNCPYDYNPDQKDSDSDGIGDLCDRDNDNDGYDNGGDRFPFDPTEWFDSDNDGIGNNADTDDDNDTYLDTDDAFPLDRKEWLDTDGDGIGNNRDKDDDNDGVEDREDDLPLDSNEYLDTDKDGLGNNADDDDDGDGYSDLNEIECKSDPLKSFNRPKDYDRDLIPDCIDTDDDDDGCLDQDDVFPFNERECVDSDGDGIGDNSDMDADNDGVYDYNDDFPTDPNESKDTDGDGIGDNADLDDNNDGFPEDPITNSAGEEVIPIFVSELLTPNQSGEESRWRIVNIDKYPTANVKIYSPSGILLYESWEYKNDWDGTDKKGRPLPSGPYLYIIDRGDETLIEEGWLYIFN